MNNAIPAMLLGRLRSGEERGGILVHALRSEFEVSGRSEFEVSGWLIIRNTAFCGRKPGKRSIGWDKVEKEITCKRCLLKIKREVGSNK